MYVYTHKNIFKTINLYILNYAKAEPYAYLCNHKESH